MGSSIDEVDKLKKAKEEMEKNLEAEKKANIIKFDSQAAAIEKLQKQIKKLKPKTHPSNQHDEDQLIANPVPVNESATVVSNAQLITQQGMLRNSGQQQDSQSSPSNPHPKPK